MKEITEDYVSFETAKLLKEKGFESDDCHTAYDENGQLFWHGDYSKDRKGVVDAPTLQMAVKWLREKHDIFIAIMIFDEEDRIGLSENERYCWNIHYNSTGNIRPFDGVAKTPEESCEAAIKYCLENLI